MKRKTLREPTEKDVTYFCRGCKSEVHRRLPVAHEVYESFCNTAMRTVKMTRVSWTRARSERRKKAK